MSAEIQFTNVDNEIHSIPLESGDFAIRESSGFNGWYVYQDSNGQMKPEFLLINGKDADSATIIVKGQLGSGQEPKLRFYSKHDGRFVEDIDHPTSRKVVANLLGSIKKEWLLNMGNGSKSKVFVELGSACTNSKNLEAKLLNEKIPHTILRVSSGRSSSDDPADDPARIYESFNCLSAKEVKEWVNYYGNPKPRTCRKSLAPKAIQEISMVTYLANKMSGDKSEQLPRDFTKLMTGEW
ncbi:MAG: hypothetical protein ACXW11_10010 [Methylotenera sp.]